MTKQDLAWGNCRVASKGWLLLNVVPPGCPEEELGPRASTSPGLSSIMAKPRVTRVCCAHWTHPSPKPCADSAQWIVPLQLLLLQQ